MQIAYSRPKIVDVKTDILIAGLVNDYVEQRVGSIECDLFEDYLSQDLEFSLFVCNSKKGRQALKNAYRVSAADDFEEKLSRRITREASK